MVRATRAPLVLCLALACAPDSASTQSSEPRADADVAPMAGEEPVEIQQAAPPVQRSRPPNTIFRSELVRATKGGKPGYLLNQLGPPEPYRPAGRFQGWKVTEVFPDDPELCAPGCDLLPGDVVLSVNGSPLERPDQLSTLVERIGTLSELKVRIIRDDALHERSYAIVD